MHGVTTKISNALYIFIALRSQFHTADTFIMSIGVYKCFLQTLTPKEGAVNARYIISLTLRFYCILLTGGEGPTLQM